MSSSQKILWGPTTWTFFHVLAEKMNENFFLRNRHEIINIIVKISNNLPCPICSKHAKNVTSINNTRLIKTKQDFVRFLNYFHNTVNKRTGKQIFSMKDMNKYKSFNFSVVIHNFFTFYTKNYNISSFQLSLDSSQVMRRRIAKTVSSWLQKNWSNFN